MLTHLKIMIKRCNIFEKANNLNFHSISIMYKVKSYLNKSQPIGYDICHSLKVFNLQVKGTLSNFLSAKLILFYNEATKYFYDICEYITLNNHGIIYLTAPLSYINVTYNKYVIIKSVRLMHIFTAYEINQMSRYFNEWYHILILKLTHSQSFKLPPVFIYVHNSPYTYGSTLKSCVRSIFKEIKALLSNYKMAISNISIHKIQDKDNFVCPHHFYADGKQLTRYNLAKHWDILTLTVIHYRYSFPIIMNHSLNNSYLIVLRQISHGTYEKQSTITSKDG